MSRPIKMTQAYMDECRQDFEKALQLTKLADGKLTFTKTFSIADRKAVLYFTANAWAKMTALIRDFDKEVAWHGVASRGEDESKDEYIISDIVVYPQTVSGATVEMDTEEYAKWLMDNADDERFENIHMQGHSHVNMVPNPSSVDLNHQEEILNMLGDDDFYIFMIWNKSLSNNIKIYDLKKNVLFEDKDITETVMFMKTALKATTDSLGAMDSWYLTQILGGTEVSPDGEIELSSQVTREDVIEAVSCIKLDTVYMLLPKEKEGE